MVPTSTQLSPHSEPRLRTDRCVHNGTQASGRQQRHHKRPRLGDVGVVSGEDSLEASSLGKRWSHREAESTMGRRRPLADVQNTSHVGTPEADDTNVMKASSAPKVSALLEELELEGERAVRHACARIGRRHRCAAVVPGMLPLPLVVCSGQPNARSRCGCATERPRGWIACATVGTTRSSRGPCAYRLDLAGSPQRVRAGVHPSVIRMASGRRRPCHATGMILQLKCRVPAAVCERCSRVRPRRSHSKGTPGG